MIAASYSSWLTPCRLARYKMAVRAEALPRHHDDDAGNDQVLALQPRDGVNAEDRKERVEKARGRVVDQRPQDGRGNARHDGGKVHREAEKRLEPLDLVEHHGREDRQREAQDQGPERVLKSVDHRALEGGLLRDVDKILQADEAHGIKALGLKHGEDQPVDQRLPYEEDEEDQAGQHEHPGADVLPEGVEKALSQRSFLAGGKLHSSSPLL